MADRTPTMPQPDGAFAEPKQYQRANDITGTSSQSAALKADIDQGLVDVAAGRVADFDLARIIQRGGKILAGSSRS
jgi:hypothetical protein